MNETQRYLLHEQYADRISPCILEILKKSTSYESKEVCIYLIMTIFNGSLSKEQYSHLLVEYFGDKQVWLNQRLISLHQLFQPDNNTHLFVKHIIDERFYTPTDDVSKKVWIDSCKQTITDYYKSHIMREIHALYPEIYDKMTRKLIENPTPSHIDSRLSGPL